MARKKAKSEVVEQSAPALPVPYISVDGVVRPCLSHEHLVEAELYGYKIASLVEAIRARNMEAEKLEQEALMRGRQLRGEAHIYEERRAQSIDERKRFFNRIGELYGIDFSHATYDSETGIITVEEGYVKKKTEQSVN